MKHQSFDHIIKEKALGHESPVPADAWNNISKNKKRRRWGAFWWLPLLLLLGLATYGVYRYQQNSVAGENGKDSFASKQNQQQPGKKTGNETPVEISNESTSSASIQKNTTGDDNEVTSSSPTTDPGTDRSITGLKRSTVDPAKKYSNGNTSNSTTPLTRNTDHRVKNKRVRPASVISTGTTSLPVNDDGLVKKEIAKKNNPNRLRKNTSPEQDDIAGNNDRKINRKNRKKNGKPSTGDDLWAGRGRKKDTAGSTKMTITAPGTEETKDDEQDEQANETVIVNGHNKVPVVDDSMTMVKKETINKKDSSSLKDTATLATLLPRKREEKKQGNIFVDISAMPFLALQQNARLLSIQRKTTGHMTSTEFNADDVRSHADPSVSFMVALRMKTGKKTHLGAGLQYTKIKESVRLSGKEVTTTYSVIKRLNSSGTALVDDTVSSTTTGKRIINAVNSYDLVSIPVFMQYDLWQKATWQLSFTGGFCFNIRTDYKNSISGNLVPDYAGSNKKRSGDNQVTADVFAGLRLSRSFGKSVQLFAEPLFQFNMIRYRMPDMINYKNIHRAGLNIGLSLRLGR